MIIKRIKKLKFHNYTFKVVWDKSHNGGEFSFADRLIGIGTKNRTDDELLMVICHELMEIAATECKVRYTRPDVYDDYIFNYDHRQHDTMMCLFSGMLKQFLGQREMAGESVKNGGKGDNNRTKDRKQYAKNHDKVKFGKRDKSADTFKVNGK